MRINDTNSANSILTLMLEIVIYVISTIVIVKYLYIFIDVLIIII